MFVSTGKGANDEERHVVLQTAEKFIQQMNYPSHTQVRKQSLWHHTCKCMVGAGTAGNGLNSGTGPGPASARGNPALQTVLQELEGPSGHRWHGNCLRVQQYCKGQEGKLIQFWTGSILFKYWTVPNVSDWIGTV